MKASTTSNHTITESSVYTNSIISINIPEEDYQNHRIIFIWKANGHKPMLAPKTQDHLMMNSHKYTCSPLDYGLIISLAIKDDGNGEIIEEMNYGPIKMEQNLLNEMKNHKIEYDVVATVNKTERKNAKVKLLEKEKQILLSLKIENKTQFIVKLENKAQSPPKGLLRIYPNEPNTLGIYINHEYEALMRILKQFKICCHFGHYLKITFDERVTRDIFICQLLSKSEHSIPQVDKILRKNEKPKINVNVSQVGNGNLKKKSKQQLQSENIIEDIYNILYTPISNYDQEKKLRQFDFEDKFNATEQICKTQEIQTNIFDQINLSKNKIYPDARNKKPNDQESIKTLKNRYDYDYQQITFKKKANSLLYDETLEQKLEDQLKTQEILGKKKNPFQDKYNELLKANKLLKAENERLKQENTWLRNEQMRSASPEMNKMLEIKDMVKTMATRLQVLEKANKSQHRFPRYTYNNGIKNQKEKSPFPAPYKMSKNLSHTQLNEKPQKKNQFLEWKKKPQILKKEELKFEKDQKNQTLNHQPINGNPLVFQANQSPQHFRRVGQNTMYSTAPLNNQKSPSIGQNQMKPSYLYFKNQN